MLLEQLLPEDSMPNLWNFDADMPNENKLRLIRQYRNELLTRCDWTQLPDAPLTDTEKSAWVDYRQALRDLPSELIDLNDIIWPNVPFI
jgi:hypothetical protein